MKSKRQVTVVTQTDQILYGLWQNSSDQTIAKDIAALSKHYYQTIGKEPRSVLPFYVLSRNYDENTRQFELFIGGQLEHPELIRFDSPAGFYGHMTIKPKLGFIWGLAVGEAKKYFYTKWLPTSDFTAVNLEYEYHTEKSIGKKPEIELLFAIQKRESRL